MSARTLIEAARLVIESEGELEDDYSRVREDVESEWRDRQRHQSWTLVPKAKLVRFYNEYGKYGRINEGLLLDIWTILHDTVLKIVVNSETRDNDTWPYDDEPELTVPRAAPPVDDQQIELLLDDPREELEPEPMDDKQIEKLKEKAWDRWFLFVSDLSGSTRVRNFGEVKGNARYSDASRALINYLRAGYSAATDEARLQAIDRLLNFAHGLGPMAHWLVEGGVTTLNQIANYAPQGLTGAGLR